MTGRRSKSILIFVSLVFAGVVLAAWTQTWYTFSVGLAAPVTADGSIAAPALTALALSELVLLLALAIAGRVFRYVLAVLQALVGVAIVASAATSLADPITASESAITTATGIAGHASVVARVHGDVAITAWPVLSLIAGAVIIVLAVVIFIACRAWPTSTSRKYTRTAAPVAAERTSVDDWDSLSGGNDPTT